MSHMFYFFRVFIFLSFSLIQVAAFAGKGRTPGAAINVTTGNFRKWDYSPTSVFGITSVDDTHNKYFVKISFVNSNTVRVERYNPAGVMLNKTMLYFNNGAIAKLIETNQWGEEYSQSYFTKTKDGDYFVTRRQRGVNSFLPCKKMKVTYKDNLEKEARYYDEADTACTCGNGAAIIRYKRFTEANKFSLIKEMSFYNEQDSPVISSNLDCHKVVYQYDEKGNEISEKYYGVDGLPIATRLGIYGMQLHEGLLGNIFDEDNLGDKGQVINNVLGVARVEYIYSDNNFEIMEVNYNAGFKVVRTSPLAGGIAVTQFKRDSKGNATEKTFYDENKKPLNNTEGYQKTISVFSARNMLTDEYYFDEAASPFLNKSGVHHYSYEMDSVGRVITTKYFDKTNKPCQDNLDKVYQKRYRYDNYGRRIAEYYCDYDGKPMLRWNGYHETRTTFNDDGKPTEISYFGIDGNYTKSSNGFSKQKIAYDAKGLLVLRSYYDGDSAIMWNTGSTVNNFHAIRYTYDELKRPVMIEYLNNDNNPVNAIASLGNYYSCSRFEVLYKGNRIATEKLYQVNSTEPIAVIDCGKEKYISAAGTGTVSPR